MPRTMSPPTINQNEIRCWASVHNAMPAEILPGHVNAEPPVLHFLIPGEPNRLHRLRIITWEDFFAGFNAHGLSFTHELLPNGNPGRGFELLQIDKCAPARLLAESPHDSDSAPTLVP